MPLQVQYPVFGRRTATVDPRAKWFTALHDEIRKQVSTRLLRLLYVPVSPVTHPFYRLQMRLLEDPGAVTHIVTQMHSFLLRRRPRSPTVITFYHMSVPWSQERLPLADRVVVTSRQAKAELERTVKLPREPDVVYLAVPATYVPADLPRVPRQILYVGTEQPRKNVEGLLRILAAVCREEPATLVKVGAASENRPRLEALARELGVADRIRWRDFVEEEELLRLYQTSAVTLVPSFLEGFSMPSLEAMSTGCPLVATSLSAVPEIVGSGGLLLDPRDEPAWAGAILRIFHDPALARDLSRRGVERSTYFSAARSAERLVAIYGEMARGRGGG